MAGQRAWSLKGALALIAGVGVVASMTGGIAVANDDGVVVGQFEIDGNYYEGLGNESTEGNAINPIGIDWGSVEDEYVHIVDPVQPNDPTVFSQGSSENDPVEEWDDDSSAQLSGNADIGNVYVYDEVFEGDQYVYIAWDRQTDQGTVGWFVELNQQPNVINPNGVSVPDRTVGDLRITMVNQGGGPLETVRIEQWDGDSWEPAPVAAIVGDSNDSTINVPDGQLTTELFNEFGFNLSDIFGDDEDCLFTGFSQLNLRSSASSSQSSALKDYASAAIDIESRCGALEIIKEDAEGNRIGPVTFEITPDPTPGSDAESLTVTDNQAPDIDPDLGVIVIDPVEPGTYTITEMTPPPGYIPEGGPQEVTVPEYGSATVTFTNRLGTVEWQKVDATSGDPVCCATFEVVGTSGEALEQGVSITVTDNSEPDLDPAPGVIRLEDLVTGEYTITETEPPTGYDLPADPTQEFEISADTADVILETAFEDPRLLSELTVRKLDAETGDELAGAVFELYRDADGDGEGGVSDEAPDPDDDLVDECTTGAEGTCTIGDLDFGTYYWFEVSAPTGYDLPADRTSAMITITAENAGTDLTVVEFEDPQVRTDVSVRKVDATSGEDVPLSGAMFALYRDVDGDGEGGVSDEAPDPDDEVVGECTTGAEGVCTVEDLVFGTYYWFEVSAPEGYDLPDDRTSEMITITAENAGVPVEVRFTNPRMPGALAVEKLDASDGAPLSGATFELFFDADGDGEAGYTDEAPDPDDTSMGQCTTDEGGTCTIGDLDFGDYYWFEVSAPTGYDLPADRTSAIVTIDAGNVEDPVQVTTFEDPRTRSELTVLKLDEESEEPLAGAEFDLVLDDGDGTYEAEEDTVVGSCTTGEGGTCTIGDLDFGTYFWVETAPPTGYDLPANTISDPIVIDAANAGGNFEEVRFLDPRLLTELVVLKVEEGTDTPLSGGVFELYLDDGDGVGDEPDEGDVLIGECTTGDDGTCSFDDLNFGTYYWYETQAPEGYAIPDDATSEVITISADNAGTTITVTFEDPKVEEPPKPKPPEKPEKPGEPEIPRTGASLGSLIALTALILAAGGGLVGTAWWRRRSLT